MAFDSTAKLSILVFAAIRVRCCDRTANFTALRERAASFTRARDLENFVAATGRVKEIGLPAFAFLVTCPIAKGTITGMDLNDVASGFGRTEKRV